MNERKTGRMAALGMPYGGQQIPKGSDIYADMAKLFVTPTGRLIYPDPFISHFPYRMGVESFKAGIDLASRPDLTAIGVRSREGFHFVTDYPAGTDWSTIQARVLAIMYGNNRERRKRDRMASWRRRL